MACVSCCGRQRNRAKAANNASPANTLAFANVLAAPCLSASLGAAPAAMSWPKKAGMPKSSI